MKRKRLWLPFVSVLLLTSPVGAQAPASPEAATDGLLRGAEYVLASHVDQAEATALTGGDYLLLGGVGNEAIFTTEEAPPGEELPLRLYLPVISANGG